MASSAPAAGDRNFTLDFVRGVAVMGILTMNIAGFALPETAYVNPRAYGGATGADLGVYLFNFVLFDGKMRGLFSFLFGASTLLVIERATARGESAARVHYARMAWLLVFGLAHLYLLWWGDILHHYALIGMVLFAFRNAPVRSLVRGAIMLLALQTLLTAGLCTSVARNARDVGRPHPTPAALAERADFESSFGKPSAAEIAETLAVYRGGYPGILANRWKENKYALVSETAIVGMETLAYMLLGMAALRSGMLRGDWPAERYRRWALICFGIALPCYIALAVYLVAAGFSVFAVVLAVITLSTPVRPVMILGWAALLALCAQTARGAIGTRIAAAGRMAFTNYLTTTIICTTLFYGYGFGLFGALGRAQLYLVVFAMWALMLLWSKPWLARFRYGPFEWLWRSLARGERQAMTLSATRSQ